MLRFYCKTSVILSLSKDQTRIARAERLENQKNRHALNAVQSFFSSMRVWSFDKLRMTDFFPNIKFINSK